MEQEQVTRDSLGSRIPTTHFANQSITGNNTFEEFDLLNTELGHSGGGGKNPRESGDSHIFYNILILTLIVCVHS